MYLCERNGGIVDYGELRKRSNGSSRLDRSLLSLLWMEDLKNKSLFPVSENESELSSSGRHLILLNRIR